jgi:hypothetical protein
MAKVGILESLLQSLSPDVRRVMVSYTREAFTQLSFGVPSTSSVKAENFSGGLVPVTTSSTPDQEVAIAHGLGRIPRLVIPVLDPATADETLPQITITQAADSTYVYLSSPEASKSFHLYAD